MKKNYLISIFSLSILFCFQTLFAQSNLADNQYGTLISNWLDSKKDNYNLSANDILDLQVSNAYFSKKTQINHVYLNQAYQGVKIHNAISSVAVKDNFVFYYANAFLPEIASKINTITPSISAQEAITSAVNTYDLGNVSNLELVETGHNKFVFNTGNVSKVNIPVELVFQLTENGELKLAWDLSIHSLNGKNWYSVRVDALTSEVISTNDWIITCNFGDMNHSNHENHSKTETFDLFKKTANTLLVDGSSYNVFPIPIESPNHGSIQLITEPANLLASPFGWHDTDGTAGADFTITRGNNVWAQEDANGDDGVGESPDGGATLTFNFPFNENQDPLGFRNVATTNLFYMNNIMHDVWYQYGFNEVSGNFQLNNYNNGGVNNDFVFADAQDGSGFNNATFGTPADGGNPSMTMFLWTPSGSVSDFLTINNTPLAGSYTSGKANFGQVLTSTPITSDLVLVIDNNIGNPASTDANDGCNMIINSAAISGKIAVLRRGACEFGAKALAAENAGAIGVIVVNNIADPLIINMAPGADGSQVTIPAIMVSQVDGNAIINELNNNVTVNATLSDVGPYFKDGSLDNGIVAHEYGHGISSRLAGGPSNPGCLVNEEQMGEGWSDWFALMLTIKATDLPETGRGIATYSISQPTDGLGIRPFQYSTDITVNPLTYADSNDATNISQPHGIGSIWATILWDLTWAYVEKYGFDSDFYNGTGGNNKVMQLVLDGLKLQQCVAGFVQGRDGILAADQALTGGEDACMIWDVFAARGVGVNASQGSPFQRTDQVEDFTVPPATDPTLQNCTALSVDEFALNSQYSIFPNPANNEINIRSKKNFGDVVITLTDINGRRVLTQSRILSDEVKLNIGSLQSGMYILNIKGENIDTNDKIIKN